MSYDVDARTLRFVETGQWTVDGHAVDRAVLDVKLAEMDPTNIGYTPQTFHVIVSGKPTVGFVSLPCKPDTKCRHFTYIDSKTGEHVQEKDDSESTGVDILEGTKTGEMRHFVGMTQLLMSLSQPKGG